MIKYYFGCVYGVYAVDESKPDELAKYFQEPSGPWMDCIEKNSLTIHTMCEPETPVTLEQILAKYPNFTPLESPTSPEVNQNGEVALTQSGSQEPGKLAGESVRSLPSLTNGGVGV